MRRRICKLFVLASLVFVAQIASAGPATKEEAVAFVKRAVAHIKGMGKEKAFEDFTNSKGPFIDRELYVVAIDLNGVILANGSNQRMVGKQLLDVKDVNGRYFTREEVELAKTKGKGWVNFHWNNPVTNRIEPRSVYLERVDDYFVLSGVFNQ